MKFIASIIFLVLTLQTSYAQSNSSKASTTNRINTLSDSIKTLNEKISQLIEKQSFKNEILEQRMQQASDTIANQNSLFDGFGVLYAIITIVITIAVIALPILTYQFGIKPSKEAIKQFELNVDRKFKEFLDRTRDDQVDKALSDLESEDVESKHNAIAFLIFTQHQGFSDQQRFKLYTILKGKRIPADTMFQIANILFLKENEYAKEFSAHYLATETFDDRPPLQGFVINYISNTGISKYYSSIRKAFENNPNNQFYILSNLISQMDETRKKDAIALINNPDIVDVLTPNTIKAIKDNLVAILNSWGLSKEKFDITRLAEKINPPADNEA